MNKQYCDTCKSMVPVEEATLYKISGYGDNFHHCELCRPKNEEYVDPLMREMRRLTHVILRAIKIEGARSR